MHKDDMNTVCRYSDDMIFRITANWTMLHLPQKN